MGDYAETLERYARSQRDWKILSIKVHREPVEGALMRYEIAARRNGRLVHLYGAGKNVQEAKADLARKMSEEMGE